MRRAGNAAHRFTTAHLRSAYPFLAGSGDWAPGVYIGEDICGGGGAFCYDPWSLYAAGLLTNPNMLVVGQVGNGKSASVKSYAARSLVFGRRVVILDRKGEMDRLCETAGTRPIRLQRGGAVRLNPLDARLSAAAGMTTADTRRDQVDVLIALAGAACRRALTSVEKAALRVALDRAVVGSDGQPTLRDVGVALLAPRDEDADRLGMSGAELAAGSRDVALEMDRLVNGDLAGMFDGPTSESVDLEHPLVVFDLSEVAQSDDTLAVLMVCVAAWVQRLLARDPDTGRRSIFVLEEAWSCMANVEVARWLRSLQKLSRQYGVQVIMVMHRFTDVLAAGAADSEVVAITRGLLSDTETLVIYGMSRAEVEVAKNLLGLTDTEADVIADLPRGRALWRVRRRSFVVHLRLSALEQRICDTDARMREPLGDPA